MANVSEVKFTRHALEKFNSLKRYGFQIDESQVADVVLNPERIERRDNQFFAVKLVNSKHL